MGDTEPDVEREEYMELMATRAGGVGGLAVELFDGLKMGLKGEDVSFRDGDDFGRHWGAERLEFMDAGRRAGDGAEGRRGVVVSCPNSSLWRRLMGLASLRRFTAWRWGWGGG